jgi:tRNA 2-thiocytidine biosynthesis protein TtcA
VPEVPRAAAMKYNRNYGKWFANDVLRALNKYSMIRDGEHVCVALSGGKDSATLLFILEYLRNYSHLDIELTAAHVKTADYSTARLASYCNSINVPYIETTLKSDRKKPAKNICSICARLKRGALARALEPFGIQKVAFGHHATDAVETFFMNIIYNRRIGTFPPVIDSDDTAYTIIRPMIHLDESTIARLHRHEHLPVLTFQCPHTKSNPRADVKKAISVFQKEAACPGFALDFIHAIENFTGNPLIW